MNKVLKRIFIYFIFTIFMVCISLMILPIENYLTIFTYAQEEREIIFENFNIQAVSIIDSMTDTKSGAIFVDFGNIYIAIYRNDFFRIWTNDSSIQFTSDAAHLIRVGENEPFSLLYDKQNNLFPQTNTEAEAVIRSLVKGEEVVLRYYKYMLSFFPPTETTPYEQVDIKLKNTFVGFVYHKAATLFGWNTLGTSPNLPPVKLNINTPSDLDNKNEVRVSIQENQDLMLINQKGSRYAHILIGGKKVFSINKDTGMVFCQSDIMGHRLKIYDSRRNIHYNKRIPFAFDEGLKGEIAAQTAWEFAPIGRIVIEIDMNWHERASLYGFRELWQWGVDNLNFPSLDVDVHSETETVVSQDSSLQTFSHSIESTPQQDILSGRIVWEKTYGGSEDDRANSIIQTTNGGYAVAGSTSSKGAGKADAWIIRLDREGNKVWEKTYGGSGDDRAYSIIQTNDGGYAVAGDITSKDDHGFNTWIIWIFKLDSEGKIVWDKTYGGGGDSANAIIQTTDGDYVVAGYTYSKSVGKDDAWIIKMDKEGNNIWDKIYGGSSYDGANSIIQTTDGSFIVIGYNSSKGTGVSDAWLVKLDSEGKIVWEKTYGGIGSDDANSIIQTTEGDYVVAGYTRSKGAGGSDVWIIRLDREGNKVWEKTYGGSGDDRAYSIIQTTDGGYAVAGSTSSKGVGGSDAWIFQIEDQVNMISEKKDSETAISHPSQSTHALQGSLHCPDKAGYTCPSCLETSGYVNHFKGFNILNAQEDCYVSLVAQDNSSIGNHNDCEVIIKGEKWLGLEDESGKVLSEEINGENFDFIPANLFAERTMNFPGDHYQYEFADGGKEFRLYLSRIITKAFQAVPWRNLSVEIKNQETNKVFTYQFEKGVFPRPYTWSNGVANYGQCVWWAAKRWVEEVDFQNMFPFYPTSSAMKGVKLIDSNYQPKPYDVLIDYNPEQARKLGHYAFVEKVEEDLLYISQFNFIPPGEVYNHVSRFWSGNPKSLYYSLNPSNEYYFKYYYRK